MTSREQFEEWLIKYCGEIDYYFAEMATERHANGDYKITWVDSAWIGWQASRESITVDLSKMHLLLCDQHDVVSELNKHGLKVKV